MSFPKWAGLTEVEVYRILNDKLGCASTLAAVPCGRPNPSRPRCNIHDAYERAEKVGFSWRARHWTFRLPSVETTARPASVR
jgi:hypothetical protein